VQNSGIQVTTSATEIAASARQLEATAAQQAVSLNEVSATSNGIFATSQQLTGTMGEVADMVSGTATLAGQGQNGLSDMEQIMRRLVKATTTFSTRLSAINEKANNIGSIITTIAKVADQTNLLSLNAAIEAEKAGEYGLGFSVVAREIRRLADQTGVAAQDIEHMVTAMQSAVSAGVMEMDKFSEEVRQGVEEVAGVSGMLGQIIAQVQDLEPQFEAVKIGMQAQSEGAQQISEAIGQLSEAAEQTRASLQEFKSATVQLNEAVQGLRNEVARFKVSGT
ncbi:MAG: methyl-accepting chemotaxis protein, partial [Desulfoferrobacter sp.]